MPAARSGHVHHIAANPAKKVVFFEVKGKTLVETTGGIERARADCHHSAGERSDTSRLVERPEGHARAEAPPVAPSCPGARAAGKHPVDDLASRLQIGWGQHPLVRLIPEKSGPGDGGTCISKPIDRIFAEMDVGIGDD